MTSTHLMNGLARLGKETIVAPIKLFIHSDITPFGRVKIIGLTLAAAYVCGKIGKFLLFGCESLPRFVGGVTAFNYLVSRVNKMTDESQKEQIVNAISNLFRKIWGQA